MTKERFLHIVSNPKEIAGSDIGEISKIAEKHPYFDAAKILKLNGLKQDDDINFQDYLKEVAYTLPDRKHLYILLHRQTIRNKVAEVVKDIHTQEANETALDEKSKSSKSEAEELNEEATTEESTESTKETKTNQEEDISISLPNDLLESEIDKLTDSVLDDLLLKPLTAAYDIEKAYGQDGEQEQEEEQEQKEKESSSVGTSANATSDTQEAKGGLREEDSSKRQPITKPIGERTFFDWLTPQTFEDELIVGVAKTKIPEKSSSDIIDSFIANNPRISSVSKSSPQPTLDKYSVEDRDEIVTETLARIYLKQNNYSRAIKVYEQLSLKNPEKRAYFASQIHFLEKLLKDK